MENVKLLRKVKKISQRQTQRERRQVQAAASIHDLSKIHFDDEDQTLNTSEDYFSKLSDELILQIFKKIPRPVLLKYARVCKRWCALMLDESLWSHYDLSNRVVYSDLLIKLMNKGVKILGIGRSEIRKTTKKVNSGNTVNDLSSQLDLYLNDPLKLEWIDLTDSSIDTKSLNILFKHCKHLRKVSLESLQVDNETMFHLSANKKIETLNLCMCKEITVDGVIMMLSSFKSLKCLNIAWTNLDRECIVLICKHLSPSIKKLNISGCKTTLLDNDVETLVGSCPNLTQLDLSDAQSITGESVKIIANGLRRIEYLAFSRCYSITPSSYLSLSNLNYLVAVDIFNILKPKSLEILRSSIPTLKHINSHPFSIIARPVVGLKNTRTTIWGHRVADNNLITSNSF